MKAIVALAFLALAASQRTPARRRPTDDNRIPEDRIQEAIDLLRTNTGQPNVAAGQIPLPIPDPQSTAAIIAPQLGPTTAFYSITTVSAPSGAALDEEFKAFKLKYNKTYTEEEEILRKANYAETVKFILNFNIQKSYNLHSFSVGINSFADMLSTEFSRYFNGFGISQASTEGTIGRGQLQPQNASTYIVPVLDALPKYVNWVERGAVTSVKYQDLCSSCFAFSGVASVEGQHFRKTGELVDLSVQNVLDCHRNTSCMGGYDHLVFEYIKENGGIASDYAYPYEHKDNACRFVRELQAANVKGYVNLPEGDELALAHAVATLGPISVSVHASSAMFKQYMSGVYRNPECSNASDKVDHSMLLVGYGTEPNGEKYWLLKNSYGENWGIKGYIKMARDANNHCGIANFGTYPLV